MRSHCCNNKCSFYNTMYPRNPIVHKSGRANFGYRQAFAAAAVSVVTVAGGWCSLFGCIVPPRNFIEYLNNNNILGPGGIVLLAHLLVFRSCLATRWRCLLSGRTSPEFVYVPCLLLPRHGITNAAAKHFAVTNQQPSSSSSSPLIIIIMFIALGRNFTSSLSSRRAKGNYAITSSRLYSLQDRSSSIIFGMDRNTTPSTHAQLTYHFWHSAATAQEEEGISSSCTPTPTI